MCWPSGRQKTIARTKPYATAIVAGLLLAVVLVLALTWWNTRSSSQSGDRLGCLRHGFG